MLNAVAASHYTQRFDELEHYLAVRTNSPWAPALDAALGKHYFDIGRYTLALEHWELAWAATRNYESGRGKEWPIIRWGEPDNRNGPVDRRVKPGSETRPMEKMENDSILVQQGLTATTVSFGTADQC